MTLATLIRRHLQVRVIRRATGRWTRVTLTPVQILGDDERSRLLVTTELDARLSPALFPRSLAIKINQASREKGRVIFGVDLDLSEVVAAIAYHVPEDPRAPLLVTALAARIDGATAVGRLAVPVLKACLHELGAYLGRGGQLGLRAGGARGDDARLLYGFRVAPRSAVAFGASLIQDPPKLDEPPTG